MAAKKAATKKPAAKKAAAKPAVAKVPEGQARFFKTRQMDANEKGFVGFETIWEPMQKVAEYVTPKRP